MNEQWARFLSDAGALVEAGEVRAYGSGNGLEQARSGCFVCDLSSYALIAFEGADVEAFLHGQLTSDVKSLAVDECQLAAYNTPKGRVLATMVLWRHPHGVMAQLPRSVADGIVKRLSMFVLRSKVKAANVSDAYVRLGLGGPGAARILEALGIDIPAGDFKLTRSTASGDRPDTVLRLPPARYELLFSDVQAAIAAWKALGVRGAEPAGMAPWQWLSVRSGIAEICPATQDQFVPQMLNLELVGGISFTKGCYPGQEIVARTQYRGEIKRRTLIGHVDGDLPPVAGQDIVTADPAGQAVGTVTAVASAPGGGYDVLACLHIELANAASLRLRDPRGPLLALMDLPYKLPLAV